jgi:hypothetical protein
LLAVLVVEALAEGFHYRAWVVSVYDLDNAGSIHEAPFDFP